MDTLRELLPRFAREWLNVTTLIELVALAVAAVAGGLARRAIARRVGHRPGVRGTVRPLLREAMLIVIPYGTALLLLLAIRGALALVPLDVRVLDLVLTLYGSLAAIRGVMFLLRVSLFPHKHLRRWELRAALVAWLFVAMYLLGWHETVTAFLDSISVAPGNKGETPLTLWSLIRSLFTVIAFVIISAWIGRVLERRVATLHGLAPSTRIAVAKFAYAFLIGFGVLLGLSASGLNLGALSIFGGALGLGLGFGLQAIAANFVSGFVLLMDKSIKPGDVISFTGTIGTSTEGFGWVQELRGRYVVVRDRDGVETLVPNQNLITNQVINWSYSDKKVRLKLPVRISYDDDPEVAMQVLLEAARCSPRILKDTPPVARLMGFHDYGLDLELRFWIADPEAGVNNVRSDVNRAIWRLFKARGITIPRAQLDVRMYDADGRIIGQGALPAQRREPPASASGPLASAKSHPGRNPFEA
ncbi:MAG TPA: mechanosensitive ion channel domain-containing protein [Steroidobacteraceae bacterium]|nr:mechanosensitive ion channel domain-containing protein [Steroidobacteraceae bacterium]